MTRQDLPDSIIHYPDPVLRRRAEPVQNIDQHVRDVAARMIQLMHQAPGVGLAAPQIGLGWRMFVANPTGEPDGDRVFINPALRDPSSQTDTDHEGCLSLPHITADVTRPVEITIDATDEHGQPFTLRSHGLTARVWQHEFDHLEGTLIIDRMTPIDRMANQRIIRELEQHT